jgi:beta-lactamase regulating signal transducer with metallopeptidase domain
MNSQAIFIYILKTILVAGIFSGYYWLALRNKKFHYFNRFYLLFSLVLSMLIPLLKFTWITLDKPASYGAAEILNYVINSDGPSLAANWNWGDWLLASYAIFVVGLLLVLIIYINKIYRIKRQSVVTKMGAVDFITTNEDNAPFAFLNNLFWKQSISVEQDPGKKIFRHELAHIQQKHTLDRLFCQLLCAVIWINPFYWLIQKELTTIHEFIADEQAIGDSDTRSFAQMLLQTHYGNHFSQQAQSFFYSSIKRRLIMLTTSKDIRYSYARKVIALPLLVLTIAIFSLRVNGNADNRIRPALRSTNEERQGKNLATTQEPPKFPGGEAGWKEFLRTTCNLDKVVQKGGGPGKYAVQLSFIVDKDGDVRDVTALNDPGYGSKEDAMRVLLSSPKWTPAMLHGKKVVYRNKISITYMVSEE